MNYIRLPRCNNDALNSSPKQPRFLEEHFEFVCNLKQSEYNGYLGTIAMEAASESFETCFKPVDKIFATSPSKPQPDFCR